MLKRIQLSHPRSTACCIPEGGTTQVHTAREFVGCSAPKNWTLNRSLVDVRREADLLNPRQERGAELVSLDRHSTTVTNVVEGCVYICRRFYAISLMRGELQHSALRSLLLLSSLSCNTAKIRTLVRPQSGQGIQAWTLRTH